MLPLLHRVAKGSQLWDKFDEHSSFLEHFREVKQIGNIGIGLDDFLHNSPGMDLKSDCREAQEAARQIRKEDLFVYAWVTNVDNDLPPWIVNGADAFDICAVEAYVFEDNNWYWNRLREYVANIRKHGMERKTLVGLNVGEKDNRRGLVLPSEDLFRRQVAYVREHLPESPSIAMFSFYIPEWVDEYQDRFTRVLRDAYIKPAPKVSILDLEDGQPVSSPVDIKVAGVPNAGSVSPIVSYRYFLDNRMVAESPHSSFRLETDKAGPVIFTVHAVDESNLAGAAQVQLVAGGGVKEGGISDPEDLAHFFEGRAAHLEFYCEIDPQPWIGAQIPYTRRQAARQALDEARAQCVPELAAYQADAGSYVRCGAGRGPYP